MELTKLAVTFKKRTDAQVEAKVALSDPTVPEFACELDFSDLTEEEVLLWAARGVKIHIQAQIKSGALKDVPEVFKVPKSGDRQRTAPEDKIRKLVAGLLGKEISELTDDEVLTTINKVMGK